MDGRAFCLQWSVKGVTMPRVKITSLKYSMIKLLIFGSVLLYIGIDLLLWHGPLWHTMYDDRPVVTDHSEVVASVYGEPITLAQLNRHEAEQDVLAGRANPEAARRASMLMDLVRHRLLLIRTRYNVAHLPDCRTAAQEEVERLASRAQSADHFNSWLRGQGYSDRKAYTDRLMVRMQSAALLERAIQPHEPVSEDELLRVYEQLKPELPAPATREVSHIFFATLDKDESAVREHAQQVLERLQNGEDFAELARQYSEDTHSAPSGGSLGVISDSSERPLAELPLFGDQALAPHTPALCRSKWGWHILLAGEITPAGLRTFEECRESLRSAIISVRREQALDAWYKSAIKEGFNKKRIKIHVK
mgnify:CR=1 FL=1